MGIGLPNTKFGSGQAVARLGMTSRQYKVAPSIAEKAIFIPKPHDRVDFKLVTGDSGKPAGGGQAEAPLLGEKKAPDPVNLPGSGNAAGSGAGPTGDNIAAGSLGANGLTAKFDKGAYNGVASAGGKVEMVIQGDPKKKLSSSNDPIPTQEEGRQVNHKQIHFSQSYDSYGRPRIGFSREPYDFAATKFVSVTSQVDFQANMAKMHDQYDQYLISGKGAPQDKQQDQSGGNDQTGDSAQTGLASAKQDSAASQAIGADSGANQKQQSVMGQDKVSSMSEPNVLGKDKMDSLSEPKVMGQDKIDSMSEPRVLGDEKDKSFQTPIMGAKLDGKSAATGSGDSEGSGDSKTGSEESAEKSQSGSSSAGSSKVDSVYGSGGKEKTPAASLSVSA